MNTKKKQSNCQRSKTVVMSFDFLDIISLKLYTILIDWE